MEKLDFHHEELKRKKEDCFAMIKMAEDELERIREKSKEYGFSSVASYLRYVGANTILTKPTCEDKRKW